MKDPRRYKDKLFILVNIYLCDCLYGKIITINWIEQFLWEEIVKKIKISCSETISANIIPLSILHSSSRISLIIQSISFSEGAFYLVEWTLSYWYPFSNSASTYLCWVQQNSWARHERFVNNIRRVLLAGVCWFCMTSAKLSAD